MATRSEGRRISPLYIVLGVVVLIAVVGLILLSQSGDDPLPPPPPVAAPPAAPGPTPTPEPIEVFEIFEGKDPFRPLVFETATGGGGDGEGATPAPDGTAPTPTPVTGTPRPEEPPARTAPPPRSGVQVEVLSVADDSSSATVRVGSRVFENATEGQTLSDGVVIVDIADPCVNFRRNGSSFRLCEGEQVLK